MKGWQIPFFKWLFKLMSENPEETGSFFGWLIASAIEVAIISVLVAGLARMVNEKNDFGEWFVGSCMVFGIIEVILGIASLL